MLILDQKIEQSRNALHMLLDTKDFLEKDIARTYDEKILKEMNKTKVTLDTSILMESQKLDELLNQRDWQVLCERGLRR
jgi:hypothetical protein